MIQYNTCDVDHTGRFCLYKENNNWYLSDEKGSIRIDEMISDFVEFIPEINCSAIVVRIQNKIFYLRENLTIYSMSFV